MDNMLWFETKICGQATFPNLRAFHLQPSSKFRHSRLFGFICDHPTVVDVDIPEVYVDFPSFVKLARGDRNSNWNTNLPVETHRLLPAETPGLRSADHPDFAIWNGLELAGFSFTRAAQPETLIGPVFPHKLTELCMETSPDGNALLLQDIGRLGEFPLFVDCTKLSLVISDANDEDPELASVVSIVVSFSLSSSSSTDEHDQAQPWTGLL
jgi:hypothetical protein